MRDGVRFRSCNRNGPNITLRSTSWWQQQKISTHWHEFFTNSSPFPLWQKPSADVFSRLPLPCECIGVWNESPTRLAVGNASACYFICEMHPTAQEDFLLTAYFLSHKVSWLVNEFQFIIHASACWRATWLGSSCNWSFCKLLCLLRTTGVDLSVHFLPLTVVARVEIIIVFIVQVRWFTTWFFTWNRYGLGLNL